MNIILRVTGGTFHRKLGATFLIMTVTALYIRMLAQQAKISLGVIIRRPNPGFHLVAIIAGQAKLRFMNIIPLVTHATGGVQRLEISFFTRIDMAFFASHLAVLAAHLKNRQVVFKILIDGFLAIMAGQAVLTIICHMLAGKGRIQRAVAFSTNRLRKTLHVIYVAVRTGKWMTVFELIMSQQLISHHLVRVILGQHAC